MTRERAKRPGTTRSGSVTISDVARMAHVGVATVSRVLNNSPKVSPKTAARVRRVLEQTKYRPAYAARALARGHTNTIELLYNTYAAKLSQDPVLLTILDVAHAELQRSGYRLVFSAINTEFSEVPSSLLQVIEHRMVDAALLVTARMTDAGLERLRGQPLVLLDAHGKGMVSSVTNDHYGAMCEAVEAVAERGHRRIGLVWSGETVDNATERYRAYHDEMKRRGLPCRPEWEFIYKTPMQSLRHRLAASDRPTALLSTSTHALPQLFEALAANGLEVPRDVSLLVVDSAPEGSPALTGFVRPVSRHYLQWDSIVHTAMKEVLAVARGDHRIRHVVLPVPFRDEGTVAPPPVS